MTRKYLFIVDYKDTNITSQENMTSSNLTKETLEKKVKYGRS